MSSASPFAQHLHTNYVPSHIESNRLRSLINDRQKLVDALNKEIDELTKRRDEHVRFVEDHSALLSPIRQMPDDILSLIFLASLPPNSSFERLTKLSGTHPALIMSHVCQRWRHMSLNTPLLWSVIDIDIPWFPNSREYRINDAVSKWEGRVQAIYEMTQLWISRSASCPLTVSFKAGGWTEPDPRDSPASFVVAARQNIRRIVDAFCDVSTRWKSLYLSIRIGDDAPGARFFQISPENIPILQNLSVTTVPRVPWMGPPREPTLTMTMGGDLVKAPSLRRLALGQLWSPSSLLSSEWSNITELSLGHFSGNFDQSFPLSLLALCPNLTRCSIIFPSPRSPFQRLSYGDRGPCLLPRLRTLQVKGYEPPVSFAEKVDLPSLRELLLHYQADRDLEEGVDGGAFELIRKFGEGLTDMVIESGSLNESRLTYLLECLPNVVSLRLVDASSPQPREFQREVILDSVLEKLTPEFIFDVTDGVSGNTDVGGGVCAAVLCPKLEKFGCWVNHQQSFSDEALVRFIASRRRPCLRNGSGSRSDVSHLNSVVVTFPIHRPDKTIRRALEEKGVDLEDMVLITTYEARPPPQAPAISTITYDELDFGSCSFDHEDYLSTVAPWRPTLGGWIL